MMKKHLIASLFALAVLAAACGGGGGSGATPVASVPVTAQAVPVKLRVSFPKAALQAPAAIRKRLNEARSTQGFTVSVNTSPVTKVSFDMRSSNVSQCVTNSDFSYTCTFPVNVAPGNYTFSFSSYDQAPVGGVIPVAANKLGIGSETTTITAGANNPLSVVLNGIAASASVTLPVSVVHTVSSLSQQATIAVLDADNDVIVTNSYVDSSGNPLAVTLSSNCPLVTVSPATMTAPLANGATVSYDPTNITAAEMTGGTTSTISALVGAGPSFSANLTVPAVVTLAHLSGIPYGITAQSTTNIWVTEPGNQQLESVATATNSVVSTVPIASPGVIGPSPQPNDILYAPDGNLYFTIANEGVLGRISPAATGETGVALADSLNKGISLASDGTNMFTLQSGAPYFEWSPMSALAVTQLNPVTSSGMFQIVQGSGGDMWYTAATANLIGYGTTGGVGLSNVALSAGASPQGIAWDGNNTMWVAEPGVTKMAMIVGAPTSATLTETSVSPAVPTWVTVGADGNAWFDYTGPTPGIGRITPANVVTLFPLPAGSVPWQMVSEGPYVWVVDDANPWIYRIAI